MTRTLVLLLIALLGCSHAHARIHAEWEQLVEGEDINYVTTLETDENRLYLGRRDGLYMSRDHGYTWRLTLPDHEITAIAISTNAVYAGTFKHGLFRSDSHGNTWKPKNAGFALFTFAGRPPQYSPIEQILVTRSGTVIAGKYHAGTYISTNRGESWHDIYDDWVVESGRLGGNIWSMTEFDGYLWAADSTGSMLRSADKGQTWKWTRHFNHGWITDWEVFNDRLYAAGEYSFGRWNEAERAWEYFSESLETGTDEPHFTSLAVNCGRLFAGLRYYGVYMFDDRSETWIPAGLQEFGIAALVSHQSDLYAAAFEKIRNSTEPLGIYHASIPIIQPYGKAATTWGAVKQK